MVKKWGQSKNETTEEDLGPGQWQVEVHFYPGSGNTGFDFNGMEKTQLDLPNSYDNCGNSRIVLEQLSVKAINDWIRQLEDSNHQLVERPSNWKEETGWFGWTQYLDKDVAYIFLLKATAEKGATTASDESTPAAQATAEKGATTATDESTPAAQGKTEAEALPALRMAEELAKKAADLQADIANREPFTVTDDELVNVTVAIIEARAATLNMDIDAKAIGEAMHKSVANRPKDKDEFNMVMSKMGNISKEEMEGAIAMLITMTSDDANTADKKVDGGGDGVIVIPWADAFINLKTKAEIDACIAGAGDKLVVIAFAKLGFGTVDKFEEQSESVKDHAICCYVDVDDGYGFNNHEIVDPWDIVAGGWCDGMPCFVFFKGGKEVHRMRTPSDVEEVMQAIEEKR